MFEFSVVSGRTIDRLVRENIPHIVDTVEAAYLAHDRKQSVNPNSYFLRFPEKPSARIIALPAYLGGTADVAGIKWIASFPENINKGFPRASAVMVLNDYETGYPFACLEASIISAARTAGSAVLAARVLNGGVRETTTLGIVGNGLIARYVYNFFLATNWKIDRVLLYDLNEADSQRFADTVCKTEAHGSVAVTRDLAILMSESSIVLFATTASSPYVDEPNWFAHRPLILHVSLRDISPEIILTESNVVDDVDHVMTANTSVHLAESASGGREFVSGTLADVIEERVMLRNDRSVIFSPFGMGILDLAVAKWLYTEARNAGDVTQVEDFFYDLER